jgi:hypothetical protein
MYYRCLFTCRIEHATSVIQHPLSLRFKHDCIFLDSSLLILIYYNINKLHRNDNPPLYLFSQRTRCRWTPDVIFCTFVCLQFHMKLLIMLKNKKKICLFFVHFFSANINVTKWKGDNTFNKIALDKPMIVTSKFRSLLTVPFCSSNTSYWNVPVFYFIWVAVFASGQKIEYILIRNCDVLVKYSAYVMNKQKYQRLNLKYKYAFSSSGLILNFKQFAMEHCCCCFICISKTLEQFSW